MARLHEKAQVWVYHRPRPDGPVSILLLQTQPRSEHGSFWQPVTGSVEPGETAHQGAIREAREETGLPSSERSVRPIGYEFSFQSRHASGRGSGLCREIAYALETGGAQPPQIQIDPKEHSGYEWVTPDEARARLKFESNRRALEIVLNLTQEK
jgi:8-oxo-dGTP pyrophosphatase MutT (NUDIX family)